MKKNDIMRRIKKSGLICENKNDSFMNLCIKECTEKSNHLIRVKNDMINSNPVELLY